MIGHVAEVFAERAAGNGVVEVSASTLASGAGVSTRTVLRFLKLAERLGMVEVIQQMGHSAAGNTPTRYRLRPASEWRRDVVRELPDPSAALERIARRVESEGEDGCIRWTGAKFPNGYGVLVIDGEQWLAHRAVYTATHGPIPDGLVLDHVCHVRSCVSPDHLRATTRENNTHNLGGKTSVVGVFLICQ